MLQSWVKQNLLWCDQGIYHIVKEIQLLDLGKSRNWKWKWICETSTFLIQGCYFSNERWKMHTWKEWNSIFIRSSYRLLVFHIETLWRILRTPDPYWLRIANSIGASKGTPTSTKSTWKYRQKKINELLKYHLYSKSDIPVIFQI